MTHFNADYAKKMKKPWDNLTPSEKELRLLEDFDDTLSPESRKLFILYDQQVRVRIEKLCQEVFAVGFEAGKNEKAEILKVHLKRFD